MLQRRASLSAWRHLRSPLVTSSWRCLRRCVTAARLPVGGRRAISTARPRPGLPWPLSGATTPSRLTWPETAVDLLVMTSVGASYTASRPSVRHARRHATVPAAATSRRPSTRRVSLMCKWRHSDDDDDDDGANINKKSHVYFCTTNIIMRTASTETVAFCWQSYGPYRRLRRNVIMWGFLTRTVCTPRGDGRGQMAGENVFITWCNLLSFIETLQVNRDIVWEKPIN